VERHRLCRGLLGTPPPPARKRPPHHIDGIGRFTSFVLREPITTRSGTQGTFLLLFVATLPLRAACHCDTGTEGISPTQSSAIRSQDEPPFVHRIGASFWILPDPSLLAIRPAILIEKGGKSQVEPEGWPPATEPMVWAAAPVLTVTSTNAAVVARQLGLACVVECKAHVVDNGHGRIRVGDSEIPKGGRIAVDGGTGLLYVGRAGAVRRAARSTHPTCDGMEEIGDTLLS
jgi:hypothetical protein